MKDINNKIAKVFILSASMVFCASSVAAKWNIAVGEFGVVLMVGGNIPGETKLISIAIYDHVESLNYAAAHALSLTLLGFAFLILLTMFLLNRRLLRHD